MAISKTAIIHEGAIISENAIINDYVVIYPNVVIKDGVEVMDHAVIGRLPKSASTSKRKVQKKYKETIIGENAVISPGAVIYTDVMIGEGTLVGDNASVREGCRIGNGCIIARNVSINYNTIVGDATKIMDNAHITGNMIIEDHVFISVLVATTNDNLIGKGEYSDDREKGPHIKRGATIGAAANLLPAITIGENALVGAGSVVTKDVPDRKVVMGVPAKIIRDVED